MVCHAHVSAILARMAWMIGIDEAGYGPNLGPLVVAATTWWLDEHPHDTRDAKSPSTPVLALNRTAEERNTLTLNGAAATTDLYTRLADAVCAEPDGQRLAIADSKVLYKPGAGLALLERAVLVALRGTSCWRDVITDTSEPWHADFDCPLPLNCPATDLATCAAEFDSACTRSGTALVDARVRMVFPREFNALVEHHGNKAAALSHVSIGLLRDVVEQVLGSGLVRITCDKHGGRNHYAALLQHHFSEHWIEMLGECREESRYAWGPSEARREICFRTRGEEELPVALASMTAKYHRELAMRAFNDFWCRHVPNLRPTAGYPLDARRFREEIADTQRKLKIPDRILWRNR